jgi:hypothetical protein
VNRDGSHSWLPVSRLQAGRQDATLLAGRDACFHAIQLTAIAERFSTLYLFAMTETETSLLEALLKLEDAVTALRSAPAKPNLLPLFHRIDELTRQLPRDADPQLLHYLQKKSYEKARLFLQGRDAENRAGSCGHL